MKKEELFEILSEIDEAHIEKRPNRKRKILQLGKALAACLLLALTLTFFLRETNEEDILPRQYVRCSWVMNYGSMEQLIEYSDLIALVQVKGLAETTGSQSLPASIFEATVEDAILGCEKEDTIHIYMSGGKTKSNIIIEVLSDPLLKEGQQYLIFASKNESGTCTVLGGSQGKLYYENGLLNSISNTTLLEEQGISEKSVMDCLNLKDKPLEEVKEKIYQVLEK